MIDVMLHLCMYYMSILIIIVFINLVQQAAMATAPGLGATHMASKVELTISCDNLLDMDVFSKSDPLCVLYLNTSGSHWYEVCIPPVCTKVADVPCYCYISIHCIC